jgi:hypothetical protein
MQELELLASLASKSGNVIVIPGIDRMLSREPPASDAAASAKT